MRADADMHFSEIGLTFSQVRVLHFLEHRNGRATQKQIEDHLNVSHPTVKGIVTRMEKSDFVRCYQDDKDRRNKYVELTDKARSVMSTLESGRKAKQESLVRGLSEAEIEEANRLLGIMLGNLLED